jgi:hypothetical protein
MLGTLFMCVAAALFERPLLCALGCACAALVRPDLCIVAGPLLLVSGTPFGLRNVLRGGLLAVCVGLVAIVTTYATDSYGWPVVMKHTFLGGITEVPKQMVFGWAEYTAALSKGLTGYMTNRPAGFVPFLGVSLMALLADWARRPRWRTAGVSRVLAAVWVGTGARFLAFPLLADRMFAPAYAIGVAMSAVLLGGFAVEVLERRRARRADQSPDRSDSMGQNTNTAPES